MIPRASARGEVIHHAHHIAALAMTLAEFDIFGHDYANQIIQNAKALARAFYSEGVKVLCPDKDFTESHTLLIDTISSSKEVVAQLAKTNIITNSFQLPWNPNGFESGIRLGTSEITRLGMKESEMKVIAKLVADVIYKRRPINRIKKEIIDMRESYQKINYCFNNAQIKS